MKKIIVIDKSVLHGTSTQKLKQFVDNHFLILPRVLYDECVMDEKDPREDVKQGNLVYWYPINRGMARLYADSDRAFLNCYRDPANSYDRLGSRAKISTGNLKQFLEELRDKYKIPEKTEREYYTKQKLQELTK